MAITEAQQNILDDAAAVRKVPLYLSEEARKEMDALEERTLFDITQEKHKGSPWTAARHAGHTLVNHADTHDHLKVHTKDLDFVLTTLNASATPPAPPAPDLEG